MNWHVPSPLRAIVPLAPTQALYLLGFSRPEVYSTTRLDWEVCRASVAYVDLALRIVRLRHNKHRLARQSSTLELNRCMGNVEIIRQPLANFLQKPL